MFTNQRRHGNALRVLVVVMALVVAIPLAMVLVAALTYQSQRSYAQEQLAEDRLQAAKAQEEQARAQAEAAQVQRRQLNSVQVFDEDREEFRAGEPSAFRPVRETFYDEQIVREVEPVRDPNTGRTTYQTRERVVRVPRTETSWVRQAPGAVHGEAIRELVGELRELKEDDPKREEALTKLRKELGEEFSKMHEEQAKQISLTEQRLEKLKATHQQRMENRDTIVQRRIDQLLGEPDPLQWNPTPVGTSVGPQRTTTRLAPNSPITQFGPHHIPPDERNTRNRAPKADIAPMIAPDPPGIGEGLNAPLAPPPPARTTLRMENRVELPTLQPIPALPGAGPAPNVRVTVSDSSVASPVGTASLFDLVRTTLNAKSDLEASVKELERFDRLKSKDAVSNHEHDRVRLMVDKMRKNVAMLEMQLDGTVAKLKQDLESAELSAARANEQHALLKSLYQVGNATAEKMTSARFDLQQAENELKAAKLNLDQFMQAMKMLKEEEDHEDHGEDESTATPELFDAADSEE